MTSHSTPARRIKQLIALPRHIRSHLRTPTLLLPLLIKTPPRRGITTHLQLPGTDNRCRHMRYPPSSSRRHRPSTRLRLRSLMLSSSSSRRSRNTPPPPPPLRPLLQSSSSNNNNTNNPPGSTNPPNSHPCHKRTRPRTRTRTRARTCWDSRTCRGRTLGTRTTRLSIDERRRSGKKSSSSKRWASGSSFEGREGREGRVGLTDGRVVDLVYIRDS